MECVALKLVSWRMSPFQVGFMACVALRLVFTAFCQVCSTACSLKFIFMAYVALFLTACAKRCPKSTENVNLISK